MNCFLVFAQRGADRSGLGLGLAIARQGVEEDGGKIHVRNLPGTGCVFIVDLPRRPT
jgi:signal transduction histidine kinase